MKLFKVTLLLGFVSFGIIGCTNLEETLRGELTGEQADAYFAENADVASLLQTVYNDFRTPFQDQSRFWAMQEHTSDEVIGPTRGPDWDDNGIWRVLHNHTWDPDHLFITNTFNELLQGVFDATNVLVFADANSVEAAQARFLRAFFMASVLDAWNQVPFRQPGEDLLEAPQVFVGTEAADFIISEVNAIRGSLPVGNPAVANQDAADALLAKIYLNYGAYRNRETPAFEDADMDQVIAACDNIINSGRYSVSDNFFDNFAPTNDQLSTELIFVNENLGGVEGGNVRSRFFCGLHYNQNPSGWNGFCTIADFYDRFDPSDPRLNQADRPELVGNTGVQAGFLVGQQFDKDGNELEDRKGNKLAFTKEVALTETGDNLEVTGIRVMKYFPAIPDQDPGEHDYVLYRFSDIWLMKAEALFRKGSVEEARGMINTLRTARGVGELSSLTAQDILDERGFELYWEGHRRQDLIRFGKFLEAWNEKPASASTYLLFPIPATALAVNPNLVQNPGY